MLSSATTYCGIFELTSRTCNGAAVFMSSTARDTYPKGLSLWLSSSPIVGLAWVLSAPSSECAGPTAGPWAPVASADLELLNTAKWAFGVSIRCGVSRGVPPPPPGTINIALRTTVWSSSAWDSYVAPSKYLTNGGHVKPGCTITGNSVFTARGDMWPWITIDLGALARVYTVTFWSSARFYEDPMMMNAYQILAGNSSLPDANNVSTGPLTVPGNPVCAAGAPPAAWLTRVQPTFTAACSAVGRYITIQRIDGQQIINLCQVEVFGAPPRQ